jgi:hypothetical protein
MTSDPSDHPSSPASLRGPRASSLVLGMAAGVGIGLLILLVWVLVMARESMPPLTSESLEAAMARWEAEGPENYDLEMMLRGREHGTIQLEVRGGEPTAMRRNGVVPQRRTWEYWTIPEQFAMIERELTGDPRQLFGVANRSQVILHAEFDPQLGYPRRYRRQVLGADQEIHWEIVKFQAVE